MLSTGVSGALARDQYIFRINNLIAAISIVDNFGLLLLALLLAFKITYGSWCIS